MSDNSRNKGLNEKEIRKDERKRVKKKKRAKGTLYTMFGALLAFLISLFSGLLGLNPVGIYSDGSGSHSLINRQPETEVVEEAEPIQMAEEAEAEAVRIIVDSETYVYEDQVYNLEEITALLADLEGASLIIEDRNAINSVFEDLEEVLNSQGIEYEIVENYE